MSAGCICKFEHGPTISIMSAVLSRNNLSISGCVEVDRAFSSAGGDEFGGLGEVYGELGRERRWGLVEG